MGIQRAVASDAPARPASSPAVRGVVVCVAAMLCVAGVGFESSAAHAARRPTSTTTTTATSTTSTTRPAPTGPVLPGLAGAPAGEVAPPNVDETTRLLALDQLKAAQDLLSGARKEEATAGAALTALDAKLAALDAKRSSLADQEKAIALKLEAARDRVRRIAVSTYVGGDGTAIGSAVAKRADSIEGYARNRVYGNLVLRGQRDALTTLKSTLAEASAASSSLGKEADRARADHDLAAQRVQNATSTRLSREQDVASRQKLADLISAAASVPPSDIPGLFLTAYVRAAAAANRRNPTCRIHWSAIAGVGRIESGHGRSGGASLTLTGDVVPRILGPRLDGGAFASITDTDGGVLDGDTQFDRAVGPMQFIPSTWRVLGEDGNGDGISDPNNVWDATVATAMYLCRGRVGLDQEVNLAGAAFAYNHSDAYVAKVLSAARDYAALNLPGAPPGPVLVVTPEPVATQTPPAAAPTTTSTTKPRTKR